MLRANKVAAGTMAFVFALVTPCAYGQKKAVSPETFDPVAFIKSFRIGMNYLEVQAALPKSSDQDTLAYLPSEEAFLLGVDLPGGPTWSASFKFDTLDTPARRPEQLIEFSCSAALSPRSESFETIVRKVTEAFGDPVEVDRSQEQFLQAGWRVSGGSVLTLEYSTSPGAAANASAKNVNIEFVIKRSPRRNSTVPKAVA
ncbi:MAG TPA: hypothetical protein VKF81_01225 [Blastocatellia bacterium]|nr:hypothetical protein [Blastocatellia bacterium]